MTEEQVFQEYRKKHTGPLLRKNVACLVHEFLRDAWKEPDEIDVRAAMKLRDLFDCRVCAGHVMQVYVKGIMDAQTDAQGQVVFGMEREVSLDELAEIQKKVFHRELRSPRTEDRKALAESVPEELSAEEAMQRYATEPKSLLLDVRTAREFEAGHIKGAEHLPLMELMKNPYAASGYRDDNILLYCSEGVQSRIAAVCLVEAGYENVSYFAWKA